MPTGARPVHCLSFDVEEHFQVSAFWSEERRRQWDRYESRVEGNTRRLGEILSRHNTRATFFVLGWVAERYPMLVKGLASEGHEIASHGFGHELVSSLNADQFRQDVRKSKQTLEDLTGMEVLGYRAPSFSISAETPWALSILVEEGYQYDSSLYARFHRSGVSASDGTPYSIETHAGKILEVPPSTMSMLGFQMPVAGGGYFRLFPYELSRWCLDRLERRGAQLVVYLHPWELDPGQPRMAGPWSSRFRHYLNLEKTQGRLERLLGDFRFNPIAEVVGASGAAVGPRRRQRLSAETRSDLAESAGHCRASST